MFEGILSMIPSFISRCLMFGGILSMIPFSGYSDLFGMLLLYLWGLGLSVFLTLGPLNAGAVLFISVGGVCGTAFVPLLNLFRTRWKGQGALGLRATRISRLLGGACGIRNTRATPLLLAPYECPLFSPCFFVVYQGNA